MKKRYNENVQEITPEILVTAVFHKKFPVTEEKGLVVKIKNRTKIKEPISFYDISSLSSFIGLTNKNANVICDFRTEKILKFLRKNATYSHVQEKIYTTNSRNKIADAFNSLSPEIVSVIENAYNLQQVVGKKTLEENKGK